MPEWTDPDELTKAIDDVLRAADWNGVLDNLGWLYNPPGIAVRLTSTQEVSDDSDQLLEWDEAPWDTSQDGMWDSGSPGTILIRRPGRYLFHCSVLWQEAQDDGKRAIFLERDDQRIRGVQHPAVDPAEQILTGVTSVDEDSYLEFVVRQLSGSPLDMRPNRTVATVQWIGPMSGPPDDPD
ncbi:MAG: hypothetical protein ACOCUN_01155, partial [Jiangellaceae bacterium]